MAARVDLALGPEEAHASDHEEQGHEKSHYLHYPPGGPA